MPCNTVHVFLPYLKSLNIPIIDMIQETANNLKEKEITHVGILATTATLKSNLYQNKLNSIGIETVLPSNTDQDMVMKVIFDIKAGHSKKVAKEKLDSIINQFQSFYHLPISIKKYSTHCSWLYRITINYQNSPSLSTSRSIRYSSKSMYKLFSRKNNIT